MFPLAIVVAGNRSGADVYSLADYRIAEISKMAGFRASPQFGFLQLDEIADMGVFGSFGDPRRFESVHGAGIGARLRSRLRPLRSGEFSVEQARTLEQLNDLAESKRLWEALIPPASLLRRFPAEYFDVGVEAQIRQGRDFRTSPFVVPPGAPFVEALSHSGELIAIGELRVPNLYHPVTVL